ncbi:DNA topoisomerase 1 [Candidatus Hepatoplasma crinochetorum Av]|uniref:DNA topoisomerase 1 n=1 Tax=Candidatus Hepatoplasma crinochetorum Av TaxID=1427984 RepID=W8GS60_9MOLU|nr:type I DNA topoisomerase [Candidatus Hepatoplasma crinochetorum]AHK22280.1 DNA topoisomerase 1 [Candidatus Hepatoplasma crinochetorum Av]
MTKKLIIVESPNKINKIQAYLNDYYGRNEFKVIASIGHVRDLRKYGTKMGLGIDLDLMEPMYENITAKKEVISNIISEVEKAKVIYLATDPDREGEAIAWHITQILPQELLKDKKFYRINFNEITKDAILNSLKNRGELNKNLINSQEARRMLDRIIGFRLSYITNKKLKASSAGRVKSSVLKLIIDRENEIKSFKKDYWWTIEALFNKNKILINSTNDFKEINYKSEKDAKKIHDDLTEKFVFIKNQKKETKIIAPQPLEMSSYLMAAYNMYGLTNRQATAASQILYEKGLITYPRTDSQRISSKKFIKDAKDFLIETYGERYYSGLREFKKVKKITSQDAHEALRPTDLRVRSHVLNLREHTLIEKKAYDVIWKITAKAFLKDGINLIVKNLYDNNNHKFVTKETLFKFLGYRIIDKEVFEKETILPATKEILVKKRNIEIKEHNTQPPARYNQSSIIKKMKEEGIGRPSTYSTTTSGLLRYGYIERQKGTLIPTDIGDETNRLLLSNFSELVNEKYTAKMETNLDEIAEGKIEKEKFLSDFWKEFEPQVQFVDETIQVKLPEYLDEKCPLDGGQLIYKRSRYGKFIGCENYPKCKYIRKIENKDKFEAITLKENCPKCKTGNQIIRKSKFGNYFISCTNFPKCKFIMDKKEAELIIKKNLSNLKEKK